MTGFAIETHWPDRVSGGEMDEAVDRSTVAEVVVKAGDSVLTGVIADDGYRPGPRVSAYRLAEWIVWNWWRLRWEAGTAFRGNAPSVEWCRAHETTGIGGGWLWPRMTIAGDGRRVALRVATAPATDTEPLAYVGGLGIVSADAFEQGVDAFVAEVLRRLAEKSVRETGLHVAYVELQREREDEDAALYRRIEALWGKDVDSASSTLVERFAADGLAIGRRAVEEVVADHSLTTKPSAEQLRKIARRSGHEARSTDRISPEFTPRETYGRLAPWIVGVDAAKAVRDKERLGDGPISDARLASMYGVSADCLTHRRRGPFAYALEDGRESVVLRSGSRVGRRFEVARLLADRLLVETDEALRPATRAATFRQKMQRAFAAEFLCPFDALRDVLGGDYSQETMESAARRFRVSALLVRSHLANHGLVDMPDQEEIDTPSMHEALGVGLAA